MRVNARNSALDGKLAAKRGANLMSNLNICPFKGVPSTYEGIAN
jgi:hypothetical protein